MSGVVCVHVESSFVVVDKPAGLLSVPGRGADKQDCLSLLVQAAWPDALIVHRLDQATSGLMVFARGIEAQRRLSAAFEARTVHKRYHAVVAGQVQTESGEIASPLATDWPNRPRQHVDPAGKPSLTRYSVLHRDAVGNTTRLELEPITGRSHQLRVHLQHIGHPIVGDALYGTGLLQDQGPRLLLHATVLAFAHPLDGSPLRFDSPVPF